jgi:plastocyanin
MKYFNLKTSGFRPIISLMLIFFALGCSDDDDSEPAPQPGPGGNTVEVVMQNFTFTPASLTIARGTTVTWNNRDSDTHTVTADDNSFSSPGIPNNGSYSRTFNSAGTISYHCTPHPQMKGTIIVQ